MTPKFLVFKTCVASEQQILNHHTRSCLVARGNDFRQTPLFVASGEPSRAAHGSCKGKHAGHTILSSGYKSNHFSRWFSRYLFFSISIFAFWDRTTKEKRFETGKQPLWHFFLATKASSNTMSTSRPTYPLEGGCDCQTIRYRMEASPLIVHCCHCTCNSNNQSPMDFS